MTRQPSGDTVALEPLRRAFEASGVTQEELAERLGWRVGSQGVFDSRRVGRQLGITEPRQKIGYGRAVEIARAIGADPVDVGL